MNLDELGKRFLGILRDPIWQSIGVFAAILIALAPTLRELKGQFSATAFKRLFRSAAIPLIAAFAIIAALWRQFELVVASNVILIVIYWLKQQGFSDQKSLVETDHTETSRKLSEPIQGTPTRYIKPTKR